MPADNGSTSKVDAVRLGNQQAAAHFAQVADRCAVLAPQLDAPGRLFFEQSLSLQARFLSAASACTVACAEAYLGRNDPSSYERWMKKAQSEAETMSSLLNDADKSGPLKGWYLPEKFFGLQETRDNRSLGSIPTGLRTRAVVHDRNPAGVGGEDGTACPGVQGTPGSKSAAPLGQNKHLWRSLVIYHMRSRISRRI